jgi:uncharacterized protein involved in response to NO
MNPLTLPFLEHAFRPFFLLAALYAALAIPGWVGILGQQWMLPSGLPPLLWHSHEMLFGFGAAIVVGFVLTAAQNWTGLRPLPPAGLAGLVALWLAARIAFLLPQFVPYALAATLDALLLPLAALALMRVLWQARNRRNYAIAGLLLLLATLNATMHLAVGGVLELNPSTPLTLTAWLLAALMVMMGGRVIPFFTGRRLDVTMPPAERLWPACELAALATAFALTLAPHTVLAAIAAVATGTLVFVRWIAWRPWISRNEPMLWILHLGYLWLSLTYGLAAWVHATGAAPVTLPIHAVSTGALGALGLGMMARVALGHTGRPIAADSLIVAAFVLVLAGGILRMAAYAPGPLYGLRGITFAGIAWSLAFALYVVRYVPVMFGRRVDRPQSA